MATAYTSLLGLALPVTGELSGTWGATVNDEITALLDSAVAGTTSITADADITLSDTDGVANETRQAIILWSPATGTTTRNITAPARSKAYIVINASGGTQSIVLRGAGPTTGVTIVQGEKAVCAWNGSDFVKVANQNGIGNFTTVDTTNLEVTNLKAKDGTAAGSIANSTGVVTLASSVLTTTDINGGTIDGTAIGGSTAAAGAFTTLSATGVTTVQAGTAAAPAITTTGDTNTGIFFPAADTIAFSEGGAEAMRIDSSGNLGLGVTPVASVYTPSRNFFIGQASNLIGRTTINFTSLNTNVYEAPTTSAPTYINSSTAATQYIQYLGQHIWNTAPSGTAGNAITFTQAMTLTAQGDELFVGTTSGFNSTTGRGNLSVNGTSSVILALGTSGVRRAGIYAETGQSNLLNDTPIQVFETGGTERARIDSSGNLLVGTTVTDSGAKMRVNYTTSQNGIQIRDAANTSDTAFLIFQDGSNNNIGTVSRVGITSAVIYNTTSDYRLKTVIGAVTGAGERIDALEPIEYEWKADNSRTRGFLAHKFQEVYAGSVTGTKDDVGADGKPKYQAMQASTPEVIADLVAEIQSLRKRLAAAGI